MKIVKIILGVLILFSTVKVLIESLDEATSRGGAFLGTIIGFCLMVALAIWLIKSGISNITKNDEK